MEQIDFVTMAYGVAFICLGGAALFFTRMNRRVEKRLMALEDKK